MSEKTRLKKGDLCTLRNVARTGILLPVELKYTLVKAPKTGKVIRPSDQLMYMGTRQMRLVKSLVTYPKCRYVTYARLTDFDEIFFIASYDETSLKGYRSLLMGVNRTFKKIGEMPKE